MKRELSTEEHAELEGAMWSLRKVPADLSEAEKATLKFLFFHSPELKTAYDLKWRPRSIFERPSSRDAARKALERWSAAVERSDVSEVFRTFAKTLRRRWKHVPDYFERRPSSGFAEGLNQKVRILKRRCYGLFGLGSFLQRLRLDVEGAESLLPREANPNKSCGGVRKPD